MGELVHFLELLGDDTLAGDLLLAVGAVPVVGDVRVDGERAQVGQLGQQLVDPEPVLVELERGVARLLVEVRHGVARVAEENEVEVEVLDLRCLFREFEWLERISRQNHIMESARFSYAFKQVISYLEGVWAKCGNCQFC